MKYELYHGDCLEVLPRLSSASVALVVADLPYGVTACKWDSHIPLGPLWSEYKRLAPAYVLTATQPFTAALVTSNLKDFRYELIWSKGKGTNPLQANRQPMRSHESVLVFGRPVAYHPQMTEGKPYKPPRTGGNRTNRIVGANADKPGWVQNTKDTSKRFPLSVLNFSIHCGSKLHPTQKPVALVEWLIKSFTNPGDVVLDNCMGVGTTGIASVNTGRSFIGIEKDPNYFATAQRRISEAQERLICGKAS